MKIQKLSIVIPVYNEESTIQLILDKVVQLSLLESIKKEIVVINDCSTDGTHQQILDFLANYTKLNLIYFSQTINKGKGAALHKGFELSSGDYIVIQDADLELNPTDINNLLAAVEYGDANVVYGSRFLENKHQNVNFIWHILGNSLLTRLSNLFTGLKLTDMMTCYKLFPKSILSKVDLKEQRFGFEPEITIKLSKNKELKIVEVPIFYSARTKEEGKKINYKDGIRVIYCILKYNLFNKIGGKSNKNKEK
jgi:glycosyltransferase involved in cell wall biosynthesis